jgi:hypothetical protein
VRDARIASASPGLAWSAAIASASAKQDADGVVRGTVAGTAAVGGVSLPVQGSVERGVDGALHVAARTDTVRPAALAGAAPELAGLAALDAPVSLTASADLSPTLAPIRAHAEATADAGTLNLAGGTIRLARAAGDATLTWRDGLPAEATLTRLDVTVPSPSGAPSTALHMAATARRSDKDWTAESSVAFDQVAAADLSALWPPGAMAHARQWLVENITAGTVHDGRFEGTLSVSADANHVQLTAISGGMRGDDLTIHWLRPVPPVEHVRAALEVINPDSLRIPVYGGQDGRLRVQGGLITITGLSGHDQTLDLQLEQTGPVAALVALLSHPRLRLLSRRPLPFTVAGGSVTTSLNVRLPLVANLLAEDVTHKATARLSGVVLRDVVLGRDLTDGAVTLDVTNDGLHASGQAKIGAIPAQLTVMADFRGGPPSQVLLAVDATGHLDAATLEREGLHTHDTVAGTARIGVQYTLRRDKDAEVSVDADMQGAAISLPLWRKPGGTRARATVRIELHDNHLVAVTDLHAEGPDLLVSGRAEIAEGEPAVLRLDRIKLDRTEASGEIRLPKACSGAYCVRLQGSTLDLSRGLGRIESTGMRGGKPGRTGTPPWQADVRFDRVLLDADRALGPVRANARSDGKRLLSAALDAPGIRGSLREQGRGRVTSLRAADLGGLLRSIGSTDVLHGGALSFDGRFDDTLPGSPLTAKAELDDFTVQRAVVAGKVLQALTLFGIVDAIRGPGLFFGHAVLPMTYADDVLTLREAHANSVSLGLTASGRLDFGRSTMAVRGTIVPAYLLNSALGHLPLVGRLFSPERDGGLMAATYALDGPLDDPSVSVNPLSMLTPGALRGVFGLFR